MDTISPVYARLVLREMERCNIDTAALFAGTQLTRSGLLRGGDISLPDFLHILEIGQQRLEGGQLGLMLGRNMRVFALGPVGAGMVVAPTLREGLQLLESYTRLHTTYTSLRASSTLSGLTIELLYQHDIGSLERFHTETAAMLLQQYVEEVTGQPMTDAFYRLSIPQPADTSAYEQAFHGRIDFGCQHNEIDIPKHWLDRPSPYFHDELWSLAQKSLSTRLKELGTKETAGYTQHVSALLRTCEPPLPDLRELASNLHVSERTLNRRLQAESSSFRQLKSDALANWAKIYLDQTNQSVESIAAALGYQDTANFRRAFRKSTCVSPNEYRLAHSRN
ncbi:MAG: AraC family transcriptional regulator ligand-binding domain-containing protein [Halioglobus sp.]